MSRTIVRRASDALEKRMSRRGFFSRAAMAGTAVAAAPSAYVLRPVSAYAAVCTCNGSNCNCGALCCSGYTEFCCSITGRNDCPPGTTTGGWWKADGSGYCDGPRYYLDCNAGCGPCTTCGGSGTCPGSCSGTPCGCANGSCNFRRAGCTRFRYGQCNQDIACLGPIVCRVVTCSPPWLYDDDCGTTIRRDNNTRFHDAACLHTSGPMWGEVESIEASGSGVRVRGWVAEAAAPVEVMITAGGWPLAITPADESRPDAPPNGVAYGANHGFDETIFLPDGTHEIVVTALDLPSDSGSQTEIGRATIEVDRTGGTEE